MKKASENRATELVFGIHPLVELLKAKKRRILKVFSIDTEPQIVSEIRRRWTRVLVYHRGRIDLTRFAGSPDHQGVVALATPFQFRTKPFDPVRYKALIMLDGIQDPRNLGALLRSVYCTGFQGVILTQKRSAPISAVCLKASAGLAEHLEIYQVPSAQAGVQELKKAGYNLYITMLSSQATLATKVQYQLPLCIVIGSEGQGVSQSVEKEGTAIILPQRSADISYNASVAGALVMFLVAVEHNLFDIKSLSIGDRPLLTKTFS